MVPELVTVTAEQREFRGGPPVMLPPALLVTVALVRAVNTVQRNRSR